MDPFIGDEEVKERLGGNICRCTGYQKIFDAVGLARNVMNGRLPESAFDEDAPQEGRYIGANVRPLDAPSKVSGALKYAGDMTMPHILAVQVLRSAHPASRALCNLDPGRVPAPRGARRELAGPLRGDAVGADRRVRGARGRDGLRTGQRRPFQGRPAHGHRPCGQERDPDRSSSSRSRNRRTADADRTKTAASQTGTGKSVIATTYQAGFNANWELDLFGATRREVEAAIYGVDAAEEELRSTLLTLVGDVAQTYVEARGYQARIALAKRTSAARRETAGLTRQKLDAGSASSADVSNANGLERGREGSILLLTPLRLFRETPIARRAPFG